MARYKPAQQGTGGSETLNLKHARGIAGKSVPVARRRKLSTDEMRMARRKSRHSGRALLLEKGLSTASTRKTRPARLVVSISSIYLVSSPDTEKLP